MERVDPVTGANHPIDASPKTLVNAAVFRDFADGAFLRSSLARLGLSRKVIAVSNNTALLHNLRPDLALTYNSVLLNWTASETEQVAKTLLARVETMDAPVRLVMDMSWALEVTEGGDGLEFWAGFASMMSHEHDIQFVSLYDQSRLIEDQMAVAFRAHKQFLAPSGLHENPFWLPQDLQRRGTLDEQYAFLLGRVVSDYDAGSQSPTKLRLAARGASPDWLGSARQVEPARAATGRWHIHCLGQLRVYRDGHQRIDWNIPGGSAQKTRTLFAFLLNAGEKGVQADRIAELLWPRGASESQKRARLHHVVAMLRKTLGGKETVGRAGEYYRLNVPPGSWVDISSFEQFCRRGISLQKLGQGEEALKVYRAAERLYAGDLFEDLPSEYTDSEDEDWCVIRRAWLAEMATKLQIYMSRILRDAGRLRLALEHAQKALSREPDNEDANMEIMQVYFAQGRSDALARHHRQYVKLLDSFGAEESEESREIYAEMMATL
ncbi:MAG: AfsR/SARP family transcriptional regulator [Maritimibacter sp.]